MAATTVTGRVIILDDITLPADAADAWLSAWRDRYLPAATARGLQLVGVWRGATRDPGHVTVVICWSLPDVGAFWAARGRAAADATVVAFWDETDALAISRDRRVLLDEGATP